MSFSRQTPSAATTDAQAMLKAHVALYRALGGEGARPSEPPVRAARAAPQGGAAAVRAMRAKLAREAGPARVLPFRPREAACLAAPPDITA